MFSDLNALQQSFNYETMWSTIHVVYKIKSSHTLIDWLNITTMKDVAEKISAHETSEDTKTKKNETV